MHKNACVRQVAVAGGFLLLCAAPKVSLGQSVPVSPARNAPARPAPARRPAFISPNEFLAGLTLTNDQKEKISQIREDTKSALTEVAKDEKLGPEVKDAMLEGYQRLQNSKIFDLLTPEQQREVRKRISESRAAAKQPPNPPVQPSVQGRNSH